MTLIGARMKKNTIGASKITLGVFEYQWFMVSIYKLYNRMQRDLSYVGM